MKNLFGKIKGWMKQGKWVNPALVSALVLASLVILAYIYGIVVILIRIFTS